MKHRARIARSGVQYYKKEELPGLGLTSIPREFKNLSIFGVYRSSNCLQQFSGLLAHCPVKVGHEVWLSGDNDPRAIGKSGEVELRTLYGELTIESELDIDDNAEIVFSKRKELSPGYVADYHWQGGMSPTGEEFQIICDKIEKVNHIAVVPNARGGKDMRVLDGGGKEMKKIRSGFLWFIKKMTKAVNDEDANKDAFISTLEDIKKNRGRWTDEEMSEHANTLLGLVQPLPDSEEKEKLVRFIMDVPLFKEEDDATVDNMVATLEEFYHSLDKDAISDVMEKSMVTEPENKVDGQNPDSKEPEKKAETPDTQTSEKKKEGQTNDETSPDVSTTDNKESAPAPTSDSAPVTTEAPHAATLDDVLSAITALSAMIGKVLDGCHGTQDQEPSKEEPKTTDAEPENKEGKKTEDSMPLYNQTTDTINQGNALDDVFAKMKGRR